MSEALQDLADHIIHQVNSRPDGPRLVGFQWHLTWHDHVSNSHSAPRGAVTNFTRVDTRPTGYPGWAGGVWVRYSNEFGARKGFGSDPLRSSGLHTGTGGSGAYSGPWEHISRIIHRNRRLWPGVEQFRQVEPQIYSWDCRVWADDFPEIREAFITDCALDILADSVSTGRHAYLWQDPQQVERDLEITEYIQSCIENPDEIHSYA